MGAAYFPLERDGFFYKEFSTFSRNQSQTERYACRRSDHYGQTVVHGRKEYDFDFLNIPGEVFSNKENINLYLKIKGLLKDKKFKVATYINDSDMELLIVEPGSNSSITEDDRRQEQAGSLNRTQFRSWGDIFGNLNEQGYKLCEESQHSIKGKDLLKHFFEYDTDSVVQSIKDLLPEKSQPGDINSTDFESLGHDRNFVFFQYCALATDIVLCDRIFVKVVDKDEKAEKLEFGTLANNLAVFFDDKKMKMPHVYLAFRNVDFLLKAKEKEYQRLCSEVFKNFEPDRKRNVIYSLFNYSILHRIFNYTIPNDDFENKMGIPQGQSVNIFPKERTVNTEDIDNRFVDFNGNGGIVYQARDLENHIVTRIGGQGQSFQRLLSQTGWKRENGQKIVPHVYFTCTPITEDFCIYENPKAEEQDKGFNIYDFYLNGNPDDRFSDQNSCVCFGSYQLLMDILIQHKIFNRFNDGSLLRMLRDVRNE